MKKLIFFLIISLVLINTVFALKVSPAVQEYNLLTMNNIETYVIKVDNPVVLNYENKDYLSVEQKDNNYLITINKSKINTLINTLEPGNNIIRFNFLEKTDSKEGISGRVSLTSKLNIFKPYEGPFLDADYQINNGDIDDPVILNLLISNKGTEEINAKAEVFINGSDEKIFLGEKTFNIGKKGKLDNIWSHDLRRGYYESIATLYYADKEETFEKSFNIGKPTILFKKVWIDKYDPKGISRINAIVEFDWNIGKNISLKSGDVERKTYFEGYEDKEFQFFSENQDITISAYENNNLLNSYEVNFQELVNNYNHKRLVKSIIWVIILLLLLLLTFIFWFTIKK